MKPKKIFKKMIKEHDLGNEVTYVSTYENVRAVAKMLCSQPDTYIESITIEPPEWAGYDKAYLLTLSSDNLIWVEKAYFDNGHIARSGGVYYIDVTAIGDAKPEDFVLEGESTVKLIGGACDD